MDDIAEKLSKWFGSSPFILFHAAWFSLWITLHYLLKFDSDWSTLTLIVSLEAIFLSLFILRAENIQAERFEHKVDRDLKTSKITLKEISKIDRKAKINGHKKLKNKR